MKTSKKSTFFYLWLTIALLQLFLPCIASGQLLKVKQPDYTTTEEEQASTTYSPEFQYDQDFDKLDDYGTTTGVPVPKSRNYGSRVRGINSSPFGANSVLSSAAPGVQVKNRTATVLVDSEVPPTLIIPRPTSSVISSTSTTSRGSYLKRRKNGNTTTTATLITTSTTLSSILNRLSSNSSADGNRTNIFRFLNRTREESSAPSLLNSSHHRTNPSNVNLTKIIIRKRPRPVTLSDDNTTEAPTAIPTVQTSEDASETEQVVHLGKFEVPEILPLKVRRVKPGQSVAKSAPKPVSIEPQPVSHYPVSSSLPSFEYNPSVAVQSGIYRYRYSEPTFSSSRIAQEDFGISHVTYNYPEEEDEHVETTTFAPAPEGPTSGPYQIKIDGSEEEFTSSLPPAYREFFGGPEDATFGSKLPRLPELHKVSSVADHAVTVTVTQTILASKSSGIIPEPSSKLSLGSSYVFSGSSESDDSHPHPNSIPVVRHNSSHPSQHSENHPVRDLQQSHEDNTISPTPALPAIPIHSSTEILAEKSQESAQSSETNKTLSLPSETLPTPGTKHREDGGQDGKLISKETDEQSNVVVHPAETPPTENPSSAKISPSVSSKAFTSVYFTKESNPYFTTSSYSFTSSTEYSYGHGHDDAGLHDDDHHHDDHPHPSHTYDSSKSSSSHPDLDNTGKEQALHPATSSYWDSLGHKSRTVSPTNATHTIPDQESGYSTPQVETERPNPGTSLTTPLPSSSSTPSGPHDSGVYNDVYGNEIGDIFGEEISATPKPNNTRSNGPSYDIHSPSNDSKSTAQHNPNNDEPAVPVYIQVLLDMPAIHFCSKLPQFKEMIVKVYGSSMNITSSQVVIFNEQNCDKLRSKLNNLHYNHTAEGNRTKGRIRFATTTASVIRTVSSTSRSARPIKEELSTTPLSTSTTTSTLEKPIRQRRHESQAKSEPHIQNYDLPGTSPSPNRSDEPFPTETTTLYPVFFYLTDKNGTYDRELTEAFLDHWNSSSSALTSLPDNSMFFKKIRKINMVTPPKTEFNGSENSGIIVAITIAAVAAVGLFILGVLLLIMRHRQAQSKFAKRCTPVSLDDYSLDNISVFSSFRRKQRNRTSKRSYTNAAFDDPNAPSRPLNAQGLTNILKETAKLEEEFRDLPSVNPTLEDMPAGAEPKNRYANVIPMPDTRVLLTFQDESPNSDFINANFVRGPMGSPKAYIITQGPLEETVVDFWRMIWEQQVRVIMMLTDFSEAGVGKCAEYYPRSEAVDNSQLHGDYQITLEKRDISENCITSFLVIKDMERNLRRDVVHLWYHSWPEKGVPANARITIDFLSRSRKYTKEPTPVVVHCSPGTGRSGTLVACDILLKEYDTHQNVNIPRTVMKIRQDRAGAVQTKDQYMHIYAVAQSYASRHSASHMDSI